MFSEGSIPSSPSFNSNGMVQYHVSPNDILRQTAATQTTSFAHNMSLTQWNVHATIKNVIESDIRDQVITSPYGNRGLPTSQDIQSIWSLNETSFIETEDTFFRTQGLTVFPSDGCWFGSLQGLIVDDLRQNPTHPDCSWSIIKESGKKRLMFCIRTPRLNEYLRAIAISGSKKEYRLALIRSMRPLHAMKRDISYLRDNEPPVTIRSFDRSSSRLTLLQLAFILGLHEFQVQMTRDIESMILRLLEDLCDFKIGDRTWCRGFSRPQRDLMVSTVYQFAHIYFPLFTLEDVNVIIKRATYARTQQLLRKRRKLVKKAHPE